MRLCNRVIFTPVPEWGIRVIAEQTGTPSIRLSLLSGVALNCDSKHGCTILPVGRKQTMPEYGTHEAILNTSNNGNPAGSPVEGSRLANFIRGAIEDIIAEWISFAGTRTPASTNMTKLALRDHIEQILNFIADDIESAQTRQEQVDKSHGKGPDGPLTAAEVHASLRHTDGFNIDQMVSEYRSLRASVVKQWSAHNQSFVPRDIYDLTRFNEAIDQAITELIAEYTRLIDHSRNMFLGILGHDLRNPIGAASMAAQALVRMASPDTRQKVLASQIVDTTERGISDLE